MSQILSKILISVSGSYGLGGLFGSTVANGAGLFFLFFLLAIFLTALSFGKTRIVLALLATYIAAFLELVFIYQPQVAGYLADFLKLPAIFWARLLIFIVLFIVAFLILNRSILRPKMSLQESPPLAILFLSVLQGIFWVSIAASYAPLDHALITAFPLIKSYLAVPAAQFVWALVPLLALLFVKRKKAV